MWSVGVRARSPLTFRHRTSVTPYTAPFGLARSCVFDKQSPRGLLLQPCHRQGRPYRELTAAFLPSSLANNHPFALVHLTSPPVSDLRYVRLCDNSRNFSWSTLQPNFALRQFISLSDMPCGWNRIYLIPNPMNKYINPIICSVFFCPSFRQHTSGAGILTGCTSASPALSNYYSRVFFNLLRICPNPAP